MNKINWKIRLKNKTFWLTLVPALTLMAQRVAELFNVSLAFDDKQAVVLAIINSVFIVLAILGIVADPTVKGFTDSERALSYDAPHDGTLDATVEKTADEIVEEVLGE